MCRWRASNSQPANATRIWSPSIARSRSWRRRMPARPASSSFDSLAGCRWRRRRRRLACRSAPRTATGRSPAPGSIASSRRERCMREGAPEQLYRIFDDGAAASVRGRAPSSSLDRAERMTTLRAEALSLLEADAASGEFLAETRARQACERRWRRNSGACMPAN